MIVVTEDGNPPLFTVENVIKSSDLLDPPCADMTLRNADISSVSPLVLLAESAEKMLPRILAYAQSFPAFALFSPEDQVALLKRSMLFLIIAGSLPF